MSSLEKRIKKLEEAVFGSARDRKKHWESTVGRFKDDPLMKEIVGDALKQRLIAAKQPIATTVITLEEQCKSWISRLGSRRLQRTSGSRV